MTSRITAPVPGLNGPGVGGLKFVNSIAETDNQAVIDYCQSAGYLVEDADSPQGDPVVALEDLKADELDELAAAEGTDLTGHKASKTTRVEASKAARQAKAEQDALDHTYVVTYKDANGKKLSTFRVADDEDAVRTVFSEDPETVFLEIVSIEKSAPVTEQA